MTNLSIRRLWVMYKRAVLQECLGRYKRDHVQVPAQNAFYLGAQSTLKVLGHLLERGEHRGAASQHRAAGTADQGDPGRRETEATTLGIEGSHLATIAQVAPALAYSHRSRRERHEYKKGPTYVRKRDTGAQVGQSTGLEPGQEHIRFHMS